MKYRKLRIAWSVAWGVVAVLFVVLWVRSYWCIDTFDCSLGLLSFDGLSEQGQVAATFYRERLDRYVEFDTFPVYREIARRAKFAYEHGQYGIFILVPHYALLPVIVCLAAVPWLFYRFSLRTLLIATTLIAVGLGLIIYATRG